MITFNDYIISWLLEENNPAVAYRKKPNYSDSQHQKLLLRDGYTTLLSCYEGYFKSKKQEDAK